jgi:hypothetical protein
MMSCKYYVRQIVKVGVARFTLVSLALWLGFIFSPLDHFDTITFGTANTSTPAYLANAFIAFCIVYQMA